MSVPMSVEFDVRIGRQPQCTSEHLNPLTEPAWRREFITCKYVYSVVQKHLEEREFVTLKFIYSVVQKRLEERESVILKSFYSVLHKQLERR